MKFRRNIEQKTRLSLLVVQPFLQGSPNWKNNFGRRIYQRKFIFLCDFWWYFYLKIYYFRTASGIEVDIILEDLMGRIVGIEIKNSDTVGPNDFKALKHLQQLLGEKFIRGIVLYTGNQYVSAESKLTALPFSSLWQE
jgi:predicted AAA+ superfamily ATPase